jgi:acetyl-CoA acetyltransferase family protein
MKEREVVIVDGARTAFGRIGGPLRDIIASKLASIGIKGLLEKTKIKEKAFVDSVVLGSSLHCSTALNPARWAAIDSGLSHETSATYVEMQCGSAIEAINLSACKILTNQADIIIAGGMESYSQMAAKFSMATPPYKLRPPQYIEWQMSPVAEERIGMAITAENLQVKYNISRQACDEFALRSQMLAKEAMEAGKFEEEIIPVIIPATRKTPEIIFKVDEHPRPNSTLEGLAKLSPVFKKDGTITAGNASGQNDGSAFVLMMSAEKARELGYTPMARWICGADCGCDPKIMGIAPAYAIPMALKRANLKLTDMDIMECNEAFAVQNLAVIEELEHQTGEKVDMDRWNPLGGAIAYGHPNAASGSRIGIFTMKELIRRGGKYGVFATCCGGGIGVAAIVENLQR